MSMSTAISEREEAVIITGERKGQIVELGSEPMLWSPEAVELLDRVVEAAQALAHEATATRKEVVAFRDELRSAVQR